MIKSLFRLAVVTLLGSAALVAAAEPSQRAVGMSVQTADALTGATKSEELRGHLAAFDNLKKLAFAGDFAQAKEAAARAVRAVGDQPVTERDLLSRSILTAMLMAYEAEFTALTGEIAVGKAELMRVERMDVPDDVKAVSRAQQGYLDMLELNLNAAVINEQRAAGRGGSSRGSGVQPVLQAARGIFEGNPSGALAQLGNLAGVGATGAQATLYAGCAALASGRLTEAAQWLQRAQPDTGYLPLYFLATGLLNAAQGDLAQAKVAFDAGARREYGPLLRCKFLGEVAALALGGTGNLQPLAAHVPANFQRVAADLLASPSAAMAAAALKTPGAWWSLSAYAPGTLAANVPSAPTPAAGPALNPATGLPEPTGPAPVMPATTEGETRPAAPPAAGGPAPAEPAKATGGGGGGAPQGGTEATDESKAVDQRADSSQAVLAFNAAMAHLQAGRTGMAESALRNSVKLWRGFAEGWLALGSLLQGKGDAVSLVEATNSYGHAAALRPEWPEPLYGLGQAWELRGQQDVARVYYQAALQRGLGGAAARRAAERLK